MTDHESDWEPGTPLYEGAADYSGRGYRQYLFNFRDDAEGPEPGPDAACWPNPRTGYALGHRDEIGDFIAWWRQQTDQQTG